MTVSEQTSSISDSDPNSPQKPAGGKKQLVLNPRKILTAVSIVSVLVTVVLFAAPPFIFRSRPIEKILAEKIQKASAGEFKYGSFEVSYFPFLAVNFGDVKLHSLEPAAFDLQADLLRIRLARFPLLFGRFRVRGFDLAGAKGALELPAAGIFQKEIVPFRDLRVRSGPVHKGAPVRVELTGSFEGAPNALSMKGTIRTNSLEEWNWNGLAMELFWKFDGIPVGLLKKTVKQMLGVVPISGRASLLWTLTKAGGEPWLQLRSEAQVKNFSYKLSDDPNAPAAPEFDIAFSAQNRWNPETEVLDIDQFAVHLPMGDLAASGEVRVGTKEIQDLRVSATKVVLENIPHYFINLKELIPFNVGFSGQSNLEMSFSGTWDHLSVHANWDLSPALLTYARFFSKPKDLPLNFSFDYLLQDSHVLSGDFSARLKGATLKGTVTDLNLGTGEGQLNVITNKFDVAGWQDLIPPLQGYALTGGIKVLANFKGNLGKVQNTSNMFNVSLENGSIKDPSGKGIENVQLSMDISPLSLEIRQSRFSVGEHALTTNLSVYNLNQIPVVESQVSSDEVEPYRLLETVGALAGPWISEDGRKKIAEAENGVKSFFPEGESAAHFSFGIKVGGGKWEMPELKFEAYEGQVKLQAKGAFAETGGLTYEGGINVQKLSLARLKLSYSGENAAQKLMDGNLFLKGNVRGTYQAGMDWQPAVEGDGTLLVTNGEFHTFDLLGTAAKIQGLSSLESQASGATLFHDMHADFQIKNKKFTAENLAILGEDFTVQASGELGFDGLLNYRMKTYVNSQFIVPDEQAKAEKEFLGPIPLLLSGYLERPELKPDPDVRSNLVKDILKKRDRQPLRNFLPEDAFAEPAPAPAPNS